MFRIPIVALFVIEMLYAAFVPVVAEAGSAPAIAVSAISIDSDAYTNTVIQEWQSGWDTFTEKLNYNTSSVNWTLPPTNSQLSVNYILRGATPNQQYQVGIHVFNRCDPSFGQFASASCTTLTRQGITKTKVYAVELGVVTTDSHGNGSFSVNVYNISAGTYQVEFDVRQGVGCNFMYSNDVCDVIFQSPGTFGTTTTLTFP